MPEFLDSLPAIRWLAHTTKTYKPRSSSEHLNNDEKVKKSRKEERKQNIHTFFEDITMNRIHHIT